MTQTAMPDTFVSLAILVPPSPLLEKALGYRGDARWMATYWEPGGDEAMVTDGQVSMTGQWEGFLLYVRRFADVLHHYDLGNSDDAARHWLVIDRQERRAYVAPVREARTWLSSQWPRSELVHMTEVQWNELVETLQREMMQISPPTPEQLMQSYQEYMNALAALRMWLNLN